MPAFENIPEFIEEKVIAGVTPPVVINMVILNAAERWFGGIETRGVPMRGHSGVMDDRAIDGSHVGDRASWSASGPTAPIADIGRLRRLAGLCDGIECCEERSCRAQTGDEF